MDPITPELAIIEFEGHLKKAEIVPEIDITELHALSVKAQALVNIDITDNVKMKEVATVRKELVGARRKIEADGLAARDSYNKTAKAIKQVQDTLLSIIGADEDRLKEFERQRKEIDIKEERTKTLPQRKLLLAGIGDTIEVSDDEILLMDDATFLNYVTERQSTKMQADEWAEEARKAEDKRKEDEAARIKEAEEKAAFEATQKAKTEATAKHQAELKAKQDEIDRIKQEQNAKLEQEQAMRAIEAAKAQAELEAQQRLEAEAKYQEWLLANNFDWQTDIVQDTGIDIVMYRKVAVYSKEI